MANKVYNNNLIDNTKNQVYDSGSNTWNLAYPTGGNYWSNYTGPDTKMGAAQNLDGSDGIRDTAFSEGKVTDSYPFIEPFGWLGLTNYAPFLIPPTPTDATR